MTRKVKPHFDGEPDLFSRMAKLRNNRYCPKCELPLVMCRCVYDTQRLAWIIIGGVWILLIALVLIFAE